MISVTEALDQALALVDVLPAETVPLRKARGRVLAEPVVAGLTQPPFDASAMDGYWLARADYRPNATLPVQGESAAGRALPHAPQPGTAVRIFTGAPCPVAYGTAAGGPEAGGIVVLQEDVIRSGDTITLPDAQPGQDNIRPRGQDFAAGDTFHPKHPLSARDLGLIAAMNVATVRVHRRPVVAIMATGDELVQPGDVPGPDQIICSNNILIAARAEDVGAEVRLLPIARDTEDSLRFTFGLANGADLIVTSGGASVGDHDLVGSVAAELGLDRSFWRIAMRPGKPLMAGRFGAAGFLGLPGNPVSAAVCTELFLLPMLRKMAGHGDLTPHVLHAELATDLGPTGPRQHYMRAKLATGTGPLPAITPVSSQDSARLRLLAEADALLIRDIGDGPIKAGTVVKYLPLS